MQLAEFDTETILYILFLVLYGIYSFYKKSMKDAEKKYKQPTDSFPTSLPQQPQYRKPKQHRTVSAKDIWKELMGEEATRELPHERHLPEEKKQRHVKVKQKPVAVKPQPGPLVRPGHMEPVKPSISEHASFLPGDFAIIEKHVPEEGVAALKDRIRELEIHDINYQALPDDFDPRTAFKYAVLLERKEF